MAFYVQSFESARWCVNNEPREIEAGQVVAFAYEFEAMHFVGLGRAGAIGEFDGDARALAELARLVAAAEAQQATEEQPSEAASAETKAVTGEGTETMPDDRPATVKKIKKGK